MKKKNESRNPAVRRYPKKHRFAALFLLFVFLATMFQTPGAVPVSAEDVTANIGISAEIVKSTDETAQDPVTEIESGDSFFLHIRYNFSSSQEGYSYENLLLSIQLPEHITVDLDGSQGTPHFPDLKLENISIGGVQYPTVQIDGADIIQQGSSGSIYLKCSFDNMTTPDGTEADFDVMLSGTILSGDETYDIPDGSSSASASVTATASQSWEIDKSILTPEAGSDGSHVAVKGDDGNYYVTYQIAVTDPLNSNRFGRLECTDFSVTDTLPVAEVEGGGAEIFSVGYLDGSSNFVELAEGDTGYTVEKNTDGSAKSISFHYVNTFDLDSSSGQAVIPDGALLPTTYQVTVKYDGEAYAFPTNLPLVREELTNTARVDYTPLGEEAASDEAQATVLVGDLEEQTDPVDLTVEKYLSIGEADQELGIGGSFVLDGDAQATYGTAAFALYLDEDCTQLAPTLDGQDTAGTEQEIDADGRVTFSNLRYGTYYLKETSSPDGFAAADGVVKVEIAADGTVTVGDTTYPDGDAVTFTNETDENGRGYLVFWKQGNSADGQKAVPLSGTEFTLTAKDNADETYTATSNSEGLVLFENLPAGTYTLTETKSADTDEYPLDAQDPAQWDVTIVGNQINYLNGSAGQAVITNESDKGVILLTKKDADDGTTLLPGAEYAIYGPYDSADTVPDAEEEPVATITTDKTGTAQSDPLEPGHYVLKETKAPENYALNDTLLHVEVEKQTVAETEATDELLGGLQIIKYGQVSAGDIVFDEAEPLPGAEFTIYTNEDCTEIATNLATGEPAVVTTADTHPVSGIAATPVVTLAAGDYWIVETGTPAGYQENREPIKVTVSTGTTTEETVNNIASQKGQIVLKKTGADTEEALSGAKFEVYAVDGGTQTLVDTITIGTDGTGKSKFLDSGFYILKEVQTPSGYITPEQEYNAVQNGEAVYVDGGTGIEVQDNTVLNLTVENEPYVSVSLKKQDAVTKTVLSGAQFALYASAEDAEAGTDQIGTAVTTGTDGVATFANLIPGTTYYYKEIQAPDGYVLDDTVRSFTAPGENEGYTMAAIAVENSRNGQFTVSKIGETLDGDGATAPLSGVTFQYYPKRSDDAEADLAAATAENQVKTMTTGTNGTATSAALAPGEYWVQETAVPDGYALNETPQPVTVKAGDGMGEGYDPAATVNFTNQLDQGKLEVRKISTLKNSGADILLDATFEIYQDTDGDGQPDDGELVTTISTGSDGVVTSGWLDPGDYLLVETSVSVKDGLTYRVDETPRPFTITAGETNRDFAGDKAITNEPMRKIGLNKYESWLSGEGGTVEFRQAGAEFTVYSDAACIEEVATLTSSRTGMVSTGLLQAGTYYIKETKAPDDYQTLSVEVDGEEVTAEANGSYKIELTAESDVTIDWTNQSDKGRLQLEKTDAETGKLLDLAKFDLYRVVEPGDPEYGSAETFTITNDKVTDETIHVVKVEEMESGSMLNPDGSANMTGYDLSSLLEPGETYYLRETEAPWYDKDATAKYEIIYEWNGPYEIEENTITEAKIQNSPPILVPGQKRDEGDAAVTGAWIGLFDTQSEAAAARQHLLTDGLDYFTEIVKDEDQWADYGILEAVQSGTNGFTFSEMTVGRTYYVLELVGVEDYVHNTEVYAVQAGKNQQGEWELQYAEDGGEEDVTWKKGDPFILYNLSYGYITLKKTVELSGVTYPLDGVTFNVYVADETGKKPEDPTTPVDTIVTGDGAAEDGVATTDALSPGNYVLQEVEESLPDGIKYDGTYYPVTVEAGKTNTIHYVTPIVNEADYGKVMLRKEDSTDSTKTLTATFKVEKKDDSGDYAAYPEATDQLTISTTAGQDSVVSGLLPTGEYRLVETSVQDGYTLEQQYIYFTIEAGKITGAGNQDGDVYQPLDNDTTPDPIVVKNDPQGAVKLIKYGKRPDFSQNERLAGVTFELYPATAGGTAESDRTLAEGKNQIQTATTASGGELSFSGLDAGDYWLVETDVGDANEANGYVAEITAKVTVEAGKTTETVAEGGENGLLVNTTTYGQLKITKVDADDTAKTLPGARFGVYASEEDAAADNNRVTTITTGQDGTATTGLLPADDYYLKELAAPEGYFLDETVYGPYTVVENDVTEVEKALTNAMQQTVTIIKTDSTKEETNGDTVQEHEPVSDSALKNAVFELYTSKSDAGDPLQTATGGDLSFEGLRPNTTYWIKEVTPPDGYAITGDGWTQVTTGAAGTTLVEIVNDPLGAIQLEKTAKWQNTSENAVPLPGATFTLYRYDKDAADHHGDWVAEGLTDDAGALTFTGLEPGDYLLVETAAPEGFSQTNLFVSEKITVDPGETDTTYTGDAAIINYPNLGGFELQKVKSDGSDLTVAAGEQQAVFALYQGTLTAEEIADATPLRIFTLNSNGHYLYSGLTPGEYTLVEVTAPEGFALDSTPITITIEDQKLLSVEAENDALGNIELTKRGDAQNGSPLLNDASFQLYDIDGDEIDAPVTGVTNGVYRWEGVAPGTYTIAEVAAPDGYKEITTRWTVTVADGQTTVKTYYPNGTDDGVIVNESDSGRIRVKKTGEDNTGLAGAVFEIWSLGPDESDDQLMGTITTDADGYAVSGLLPAAEDGTVYRVKEVKAPDGYTLDERFYETEQLVTVLPIQEESKLEGMTDTNYAVFTNKKTDDIMIFDGEIRKTISPDEADESLLMAPFTTEFTLRGYAQAQNEIPLNELTVTDSAIAMQYRDGSSYVTETTREDAYRIDSVTVYQAYNAINGMPQTPDDEASPVRAVLEYQSSENLGSQQESSWQQVPGAVIEDTSEIGSDGVTFEIPDELDAMAFRVRYTGVEEYFFAQGIDFTVTFAQRPSDDTLHEITRIQNTAQVSYTYNEKTQEGQDNLVTLTEKSNTVEATLPLVSENRVPVSIAIRTTDGTTTYTPDSDVNYQITARNESTTHSFRDPVISFDLPNGMTLNDFVDGTNQFIVRKMSSTSSGEVGDTLDYELAISETTASTVVDGKPVPIEGSTTEKVTMEFPGVELEPGEWISIEFAGHIGLSSASTLYCPVYLGSLYELPKSQENPFGISYTQQQGGTGGSFVEDEALDEVLGDGEEYHSEYLNNNAQITVGQNNSLTVSKMVKGEYDDDYKNSSQTAHTSPGGSIDYKIRLTNGSQTQVETARLVDILPFAGDTYVDRQDSSVPDRGTTLERRATLTADSIVVQDQDGNVLPEAQVTIYYSTDPVENWTAEKRLEQSEEEELPMLQLVGTAGENLWTDSNSIHSWTTEAPADLSTVTAIGVEVDATLAQNEYIEVLFQLTAPQYATEEGDEFLGKYISNSAMGAVIRAGSAEGGTIDIDDQTEPLEVKCTLDMPKGSIGDYAFYDENQNGVQDQNEAPVSGLEVRLHVTRTDTDGTVEQTILTDTTDGNGAYLFDNLECNTLREGRDPDSTDPSDYVGDVYYTYQVEFDNPPNAGGDAYVPTRQYAGNDEAVDSNIDANGMSEVLTLSTSQSGTDIVAEQNLTIDAGFVIPSALGDRVWLDGNRNGVQDADETGLNGVRVRLYTVENGVVSTTPLAETLTADNAAGEAGYYWFEGLTMGEYVVEFDVTSLRNDEGLYAYGFTQPDAATQDSADSDAKHETGGNDRVMRTDVIDLGYHVEDDTWDAGLVYYSALGGYAFEDRNYNDIQDLQIALTGTKVSLYRVINGIREEDPYRTTTVDDNGEYLFEYLVEGQYQVYFDFPDGYQAAEGNQGTNDELDSDVSLEMSADLNTGYTEVIDLPANTISLHWDGGARQYGTIGDYVWVDSDKDGIQDQGEQPVEGITVYLQQRSVDADGNASYWSYYAVTTTDSAGRYRFTGLESGMDSPYEYRVIFDLTDGYVITTPNAGSNTQLDSDALDYMEGWGYWTSNIDLGYGETDLSWDAGVIYTSGSVGDYVWLDENHDGIQNEENTGVAGIPVVLEYNAGDPTQEDGWQVVGETVTGSTGYYRFDDLSAGYYRVRFQVEAPYTVTGANLGDETDAFRYDSDGSIAEDGNWYYSRPFYLEEEGFDMSWDCGLYLGRSGFLQTNDWMNPVLLGVLIVICLGALGAVAWLIAVKKRNSRINRK